MITTDKDNFYNNMLAIRFLNHARTEFSQEDEEKYLKALEEFVKKVVPIIEKYGWFFRLTDEKDPEYEKLGFCAYIEPIQKKIKFGVQALSIYNEEGNVAYIDTLDWSEV